MLHAVLLSIVVASAPETVRISALVLPMDKGTEALAVRVEAFADEALSKYKQFRVKQDDQLFPVAVDAQAVAALKQADSSLQLGKSSFTARRYDEAERTLRATIGQYQKAAPALSGCSRLCEAVALNAAAMLAMGDAEEAKIGIVDLLSLNSSFAFDDALYSPQFRALQARVASSLSAQLRGSLSIKTLPAGARVLIDGEFRGYSPVTLQTLPIGKHIVKIERAGFVQTGLLVDLGPSEQQLKYELVPTAQRRAFDALADKLASEALNKQGGPTLVRLSNTLKLDRAIVGMMNEVGEATELVLAYVDLRTGHNLGFKRASFQKADVAQLGLEVSRLVNTLVNNAEGAAEKPSRSSDPLDHKQGTEEWQGEDQGGRNTARDKKAKRGDPLDDTSGTEDW